MIEFGSVKMKNIIRMEQIHGNKVSFVGKKDKGTIIKKCDGLLTDDPEVVLSLRVADCLPIFMYSPTTNSIGLIHAGWRGLYKGIINKAILALNKKFGTKAEDINIFIGPHICQKHYEVKNDVAEKFEQYPKALKKVRSKTHLDLGKVAKDQLIKSGINKDKIKFDRQCTFENKNLNSYRRGDLLARTDYLFRLPDSS
ncbi:MAG: Multi-copper polyphenol oxidoreductase, laccase [Candidatus Shapirobacteria bacterium GW2011_GWE1_38_10]|uniref:Purine nucleoside phosphorylase n=1 Tax=Candidatus Shapirobacteria bacterium GW2011_GWE1_38_10 TaxID=1618488 RepID=A0A0G0IBM2_9BACT|nr:MAG: Multi-copper polyphenol oxidoreductase, laccase [Candidatus Shapirobacteria bacterium GW2011_GWE1_38_10]